MAAIGDDADELSHTKKARQQQPVTAFGGQGHSLGGQSHSSRVGEYSGAAAAAAVAAADVANSNHSVADERDGASTQADAPETELLPEVVVDNSLPTTQVRIAVPGRAQQLIATFNLTHTVGHVRRYVAQHAGIGHAHYHLQVLRPATRLDDLSVTIVAAKLERATINIVIHE